MPVAKPEGPGVPRPGAGACGGHGQGAASAWSRASTPPRQPLLITPVPGWPGLRAGSLPPVETPLALGLMRFKSPVLAGGFQQGLTRPDLHESLSRLEAVRRWQAGTEPKERAPSLPSRLIAPVPAGSKDEFIIFSCKPAPLPPLLLPLVAPGPQSPRRPPRAQPPAVRHVSPRPL